MKDVLELYWKLRKESEDIGDSIAEKFGVEHYEDPASFFSMSFNNITITLELLDYYYDLWGKLDPLKFPNIDLTKKQNGERVLMAQKMCFIENMSSFEFLAKKITLNNEDIFGVFNGRVYLFNIMKKSKSLGLIDESTFNLWSGLIELRNTIIHNNAISEKNVIYNYSTVKLEFIKNEMIQGNLKMYPLLIHWLIKNAERWLIEIDVRLENN
ncbi:hypothetical protein A6E10_18710 [Aliivibrio fischeri]|nr:hypothetical protein A6E10_18710 [Aliivibrio fischeri]